MNNRHINFYLTVLLLLFANLLFAANDTLINSSASWKYLDNGSNQDTAWRSVSFSDASWAAGNAQLGYGDGDEATVVSYGPATNNRYITTYFRKTISVANPANYTGLKINLLRDDGAIVYLNGVEVVRSNMPAGAIAYNTLAVNGIENAGESTYNTFTISQALLATGNNVIAVEIHQKAVTSNDISFDLRLIASQTCDVPSGISVSGITTGKATVNWNAVPAAQNYSVQYRASGASTWKTKTATTNSYTITSLLAGTTYEYRVKTNCSLGGSAYAAIQTFTTLVVCSAPSTQNTTAITSSAATLNWSPFANALTYKVKYRKTGTVAWTTINTALTNVNISGLQANSSYEWTVQSICSNNSSVVSPAATFTTLPACETPSNLNVINLTPVSCTLTCDAVANAVSYDFQYRPTTVFTWTTVNSASPSLNINGMQANTDYIFHVRSNCNLGFTSAYSSDNIFSTPDVCGVPANLNNLTTTLTTADATWDAVPGSFDYDIEYRKIGTLTWNSFNTSNTSYLFTSLIPNADYACRVRANCPWSSNYSSENIFSTSSQCDDATSLTVSNITTTSVQLNWSANTYAASYDVEYRIAGSGTWNTVNSLTNFATINSLLPASLYEWRVRVNCNYNSSSSFVQGNNFTTLTPPCNDAAGFSVTDITINSSTLIWNNNADAASYDVRYRIVGNANWTTINVITNSLSAASLSPASDYEWQVRTNCIWGNSSSYVAGNNFTTLTPPCNDPSNLATSSVTINSATLSWNSVAYAADYTVQYRTVGNPVWTTTTTMLNSIPLSSLSPASDYEWQVRANCIYSNTSNYTAGNNFTTLTPICNDPSNLTTTNITDVSATFNWSAVTDASDYELQYRLVGNTTWISINTSLTTYTINSLSAVSNYEWQLKANCIYGNNSNFVSGNGFTTLPPPCANPSGHAVSNITINSADLSWDNNANASSYDVRYRIVGNPTWINVNSATNSINTSSLSPASVYEWQVRTNCILGNSSSYIAGNNFTTLTPPCNEPANLSVSNITINSALVSWSAVTYASNYTVQYRVVGNTTWTSATVTGTSTTISSLSIAANYEWQVRTNCIYSNTSNYAAGTNFTTLTPPCNDPSNLTTTNITDVSVTFNWSAVSYASDYDLQYRLVGNPTWITINTALTTVTINTLSAFSNYEWQLKANCIYGNNSNFVSGTGFTTLPPPCANPSGHSVSNITINSADLSWDNNANASSYDVRYRIVGNPTWINVNSATNSINILSLSPASVYEWQVRTNCILGNSSSYIAGNNFTTLTPPCNEPANLSVSNITINSAIVSWSAVTYASNYTVQYRVVGNTTWTSATVTGTSATISSLSIASNYEWQVRTNCIYSNNSNYAAGTNFTTLTPPCNDPSNLNVTNIFAIAATCSWSAVTYAGSYDFQYRDLGNPTWTTINTASTSVSLNTLSPLTTYEWQVKTNCIYSNTSGYTSGNNFSTPAIPACNDYPANLTVGTVAASTAAITWASVAGVYQYNIHYRNIGNATWSSTTATTTSKTLTALVAATTYEVQIQTDCGGSVSPYSSSVSFTTSSSSAADSLITAYGNWKYLDNGTDQGTAWEETSFNDAAWASGNAELGYGDGDENTIVSFGPNTNDKYTTTYFRKTFSVANPATYASLALNIVRDDGAVVYINGTEVMRSNMPAGTITSSTLASSSIGSAAEYTWQTATVGTTALVAGTNTIAVEIHQNDSTSSDISFNLKLAGTKNTIATLSRSPYLQVVTPTSFRVRWRTSIATNSRVRFGTTMSYGSEVNDGTSSTEHDILISGLTPNTVYYYTIGSSSQDMQGDVNNYCKTSLPTASTAPFRVWATGDFGNNSSGQANTRNAMETYTAGNRPNFWIWMGDNAYNSGTDAEYNTNVFNIYPSQFKNIPVYPSLGNHDYANAGYKSATSLGTGFPYFSTFTCPAAAEAGGVASGTEKYYSYNYGNAHFIVIDSYGSLNASGSPQYTWLQNDLAANTQRWTIAYFHHPPYTMGTHNSDTETELIDMRNNIAPLLEQYKVDLVLNGHSHNYERTWLIKGHTGLENSFNNSHKVDTTNGLSPYYLKTAGSNFDGTVYCVCGNSGQGGTVTTQGSWPHAAMRQYSKIHWGSMIIDFNADTLDAKFLTSTATVYDRFKIVKSNTSKFINTTFDKAESEISAYPNPFNNQLTVNYFLKEASPTVVEIFDLLGQRIYSNSSENSAIQSAGYHELNINSSVFNKRNGVFIVQVKTNNKVLKTMVEKVD